MADMVDPVELDKLVADALKNAIENGYDEVRTDEPRIVAMDLMSNDSFIETKMSEVEDLEEAIGIVTAAVERWRIEHRF